MQEQNALIGVAIAGYFPDISLSGLLQWVGSNPLPFHVANEVWSLGAAGAQVLFNGGLTSAQVDAARAVYWQSVANYRQTVLTAFQQVEDQLAAVRILRQELVRAAAGGEGCAHRRRCLFEPIQGRHGGVHDRRDGGNNLAGRRGSRIDHPPEPVSCQRQPDPGARRRLGHNLLPTPAELVQDFSLLPQL